MYALARSLQRGCRKKQPGASRRLWRRSMRCIRLFEQQQGGASRPPERGETPARRLSAALPGRNPPTKCRSQHRGRTAPPPACGGSPPRHSRGRHRPAPTRPQVSPPRALTHPPLGAVCGAPTRGGRCLWAKWPSGHIFSPLSAPPAPLARGVRPGYCAARRCGGAFYFCVLKVRQSRTAPPPPKNMGLARWRARLLLIWHLAAPPAPLGFSVAALFVQHTRRRRAPLAVAANAGRRHSLGTSRQPRRGVVYVPAQAWARNPLGRQLCGCHCSPPK